MKLGIVNDLMIDKVKSLLSPYVGRIDMSKQIALTDDAMINMANKLRSTYTLWIEGHDLRS
jgi:hypothetical protein